MAETYGIASRMPGTAASTFAATRATMLTAGFVVVLGGRHWLVVGVDGARAEASPARYRLALRHPDGTEETAAFRRFRAAPLSSATS